MSDMSETTIFNRIAIIGIGLIGSSISRAIKMNGLVDFVSVTAKSQKSLDTAVSLGIADSVTLNLDEAVKGADIVMICSPMSTYAGIMESIAPNLKTGAILTDVGSVKASVIRDLSPKLPAGVHLVPAHPVAGTEHSGPESGFAELFEGRWCVITPPTGTDQSAVNKIADLWRAVGSNVEFMDPFHHDQVMAMTSHLPHLIAYTIVGTATDLEKSLMNEVIKYSAGGFRDFTRIAASDPTMWRDVMLNNKDAILEMLQRFNEDLTALQRAIRWDEYDTLYEFFLKTRSIRRGVIEANQEKMYE
ncbi:MAG TPA: prephenate/arogenate dehydrogenase family protein [Rhodospirillales bacterium]|jgi:cyclohexadieny/prephenate dehydrogenase|nr:cyclohexadienyl dehydrogenase [Rhodospirillaceae bacterium]HHZ77135.1 prephenate/arogenate dehydrogenase family protein [Rhodospirillales bacterium]HIB22730.1 prephenate/arogenate dehydrogenase family protein [Rhodospirillales bacterium]HIO39517.1 prephenate/arogenate dehydrogenase family protein [Rhodospirillales bacterium]HIP08926.1 prephenate/arogenate dehydrogenase family protein [Rhodospirillales bacterium]|tara:strand:- start:173 stop:1081 length:909 start_codon:yes stop_codon:yes gene_type:complete